MDQQNSDQLEEYQRQLAEVDDLLKASPGEESLLSLKSDLLELISIAKQASFSSQDNEDTQRLFPAVDEKKGFEPFSTSEGANALPDTSVEPPTKKARKQKDFEVPVHLVPLESDSEAEKNRKRRAIKALKSKFREEKKTVDIDKKKNSWQSFQKKTKGKIKEKSIFSTSDGDGKVGVSSSGRHMTSFEDRKRFK